jgi:hypothetical protein
MTNKILLVYLTHLSSIMRIRTRNPSKLTTVTIREDNYQRLRNLGKTGDTFNDVLTRVLDQVEGKDEKK